MLKRRTHIDLWGNAIDSADALVWVLAGISIGDGQWGWAILAAIIACVIRIVRNNYYHLHGA